MEGVEKININFIDRYWTSIHIPASVTDIEITTPREIYRSYNINNGIISAIICYKNLKEISIDDANPKYDSRNNCNAIIETADNKLIYACDETVIPSSIQTIGNSAFYFCHGIDTITVPEGITTIENCAFALSSVTAVHLPSSVTSIENDIFGFGSNLAEITVSAQNPVYDSRDNCNAIIETANNKLIIGCSTTTIPTDIVTIGEYAFFGCHNLQNIKLPEQLKTIEQGAFLDCGSLTNISLPKHITCIEENTFALCRKLQYITLSSELATINSCAFAYCESLQNITLPSGLSHIDHNVFINCTNLQNLIIPDGIKNITLDNILRCSNLKSITLPKEIRIEMPRNDAEWSPYDTMDVEIIWNETSYQGFRDFQNAYNAYHSDID